jgi:hypothetical protein
MQNNRENTIIGDGAVGRVGNPKGCPSPVGSPFSTGRHCPRPKENAKVPKTIIRDFETEAKEKIIFIV